MKFREYLKELTLKLKSPVMSADHMGDYKRFLHMHDKIKGASWRYAEPGREKMSELTAAFRELTSLKAELDIFLKRKKETWARKSAREVSHGTKYLNDAMYKIRQRELAGATIDLDFALNKLHHAISYIE